VFSYGTKQGNRLAVMNVDGSNVTDIFDATGRWGSWSPDGQQIAFQYETKVVRTDPDGSNQKTLLWDIYDQERPRWSPAINPSAPSYNMIAYVRMVWPYGQRGDLVAYQSEGGEAFFGAKVLIEEPDDPGMTPYAAIAWSPDGDMLAVLNRYSDSRDDEIVVFPYMDPTDQTVVFTTPNLIWGKTFDWSRNGDRLAFAMQVDGETGVYVLDLATGVATLTVPGMTQPVWSQDDSKLLVMKPPQARKDENELYVYDIGSDSLTYIGIGMFADWKRCVTDLDTGVCEIPGTEHYPPAAVTGVTAVPLAATHQSVTLTWTATGDDGTTGQASGYEIRYAFDGPMTEQKWDSEPINRVFALTDPFAVPSDANIIVPAPAGTTESVEIAGLAAGTTYYFGVKAHDEAGNWSPLAVATGATTLAAGPDDWAITDMDPDCVGNCGNRNGVDFTANGRVGVWFVADEAYSYNYRDPGAAWQHETPDTGLARGCLAFAYSPSGVPWASTCRDGPLEVMYKDGTSWIYETVDQNSGNGAVSLAHDPANGEPHMGYRRDGNIYHAWRDNGDWSVEQVDGGFSTVAGGPQPLAFHPTEGYPTMAYVEPWDDVSIIWFSQKIAGTWTREMVHWAEPSAMFPSVDLAYHPTGQYAAVAYGGYVHEGVHYRYRTESGWSDPELVDVVGPEQTGGYGYNYRKVVLAFTDDGSAYIGYKGRGFRDVFRIAANDGSGWQVVHTEINTQTGHIDIAVSPVTGLPVLTYGFEPPKFIELLPAVQEPGITVSPTSGLVTTEGGGTDTFTVRLNAEPTADVAIGLSSSDTSEGLVSPSSLTFDSGNWSIPQTVTVTGANDPDIDGDVAYTILTAAALSADSEYNGMDADDVTVTNLDDDGSVGTSHIADLDGVANSNKNKWYATITILVHDNVGSPVQGATVSGTWVAGASGTDSCTTDVSGTCTVVSGQVSKNVSPITFRVDDVTHATLTYAAADNYDPDGDSDGTTISVNKP